MDSSKPDVLRALEETYASSKSNSSSDETNKNDQQPIRNPMRKWKSTPRKVGAIFMAF